MTVLARAEPRLRTVWHPAPEQSLIETPNITLVVQSGPAQGQLNCGKLIKICI